MQARSEFFHVLERRRPVLPDRQTVRQRQRQTETDGHTEKEKEREREREREREITSR